MHEPGVQRIHQLLRVVDNAWKLAKLICVPCGRLGRLAAIPLPPFCQEQRVDKISPRIARRCVENAELRTKQIRPRQVEIRRKITEDGWRIENILTQSVA